jgi:DNA-binding CsgD family transcriptional regulator
MSITRRPAQPRPVAPRPLAELEVRILEFLAAGASSTQMSMRLHLSRQGVDYHMNQMLRRFEVESRSALVSRAYLLGILEVGVWPPRVAERLVR